MDEESQHRNHHVARGNDVVGVDVAGLAPGEVRKQRSWTTGVSGGEPFAVSSRCRHQLADLSKGHVDADGCLVCPWHASRYDVRTGEMVDGPRGFLVYRGPTPGYTGLVKAYARHLRLRVARAIRSGAAGGRSS